MIRKTITAGSFTLERPFDPARGTRFVMFGIGGNASQRRKQLRQLKSGTNPQSKNSLLSNLFG